MVSRVNREHRILKEKAIKEREAQEKNLEKIRVRQQKNHELYDDGEISREEFLNRREELNRRLCELREKQTETSMVILEEGKKEIPKETIWKILQSFSRILSSDIDRTIRKKLLHLLISEITMDQYLNIEKNSGRQVLSLL